MCSWWVCPLLLEVRIRCGSKITLSWSCCEHEAFNLFRWNLSSITRTQSPTSWTVRVLRISLFVISQWARFSVENSSSFSRCLQFGFFFCPFTYGFSQQSCSTCLTIRLGKCIQVLLWPVSGKVFLELTCVLLVDLCWAIRILSHQPKRLKMTCLNHYSNNHRWQPHEVRKCSFSFVSGLQCNSESMAKPSFRTKDLYLGATWFRNV